MSPASIIRSAVTRASLGELAKECFGDMVKAVVDIERGIMAIGGELHADEEHMLLEDGSSQEHLWGINIYPERKGDGWIEYDSMINMRPRQGNRSRSVEDPLLRKKILAVVLSLVSK
ncbi:MAG: DUF5674 family protein [Candidatus Peribacteraceae bacterium]|nr:DUF5674 family protein [Candidatus Peribacteraceae bacterium]